MVEASFNYNIVNGITFWSSRSAYNYWSLALLPSLVRSHQSLSSSTYCDWTILLITPGDWRVEIFSVLGCLGTGGIVLQQRLIPTHWQGQPQPVAGDNSARSLRVRRIIDFMLFQVLRQPPSLHYRNQDFLKVYIWYGEYQKLICPTSARHTEINNLLFYSFHPLHVNQSQNKIRKFYFRLTWMEFQEIFPNTNQL